MRTLNMCQAGRTRNQLRKDIIGHHRQKDREWKEKHKERIQLKMQFLLGKNSFGQQLGWRNVHYRASFVRFRDQSRYKKPYLSSLIILHGMQYYTDSRFSSDLRFIIIASRLLTLFFPDSQLKVEKTFIRQEYIYP